jgi:hypothetical protein
MTATTLLGVGSIVSFLNYANISNHPNLSQYALSTDLTNKRNALRGSTTFLSIGSNITALHYDIISNPPTLNFLPLTGSAQLQLQEPYRYLRQLEIFQYV